MKIFYSIFVVLIFLSNANADYRVINVAKSGGDFTSPIAAMNSIKDASSNRRYKIKIGPGEYKLGFGKQLVMKPYVSLEGAGTGRTIISGTVVGRFKGLIRAVENTLLSHLRVSNSVPVGTTNHLTGIYIGKRTSRFSSGVVMYKVVVSAKTTGILVNSNDLKLEEVSVGAGYTGLHAYNSTIDMSDVRISSGHANRGIAPISIGGVNMRFINSDVTIDNLFSPADTDVGPVHIYSSQTSDLTIKNSELSPNSTGTNFVNDATSKIKIIRSSFGIDGSALDPNIRCMYSFDIYTFEEVNNNCEI